ncbi:MAG: hypothetical protein ACI85O_002123 [Saprospiraceae bacterium]|jgi:hypothetical protein
MSKDIAKSPEMIAKEAEIKTLVTKIKKTRTTLKSLKTRLSNSQQDFVAFQTRMQTEMMSRMEKMQTMINEIIMYAEKLRKASFLSKADKIGLKDIVDMLGGQSVFGDGFEEYQEQKRKAENGEFDFDENARAKARDMFKEFNVEPPKEEQRKIRQVFISLSSKFHPDKARNDKDRADFHILMQEINTAYQSHDIDKLLEIERMYVHSEAIDLTGKAVTVDVLTEEINRLQRELEFLEGQVERTSGEIKNFRKSDLGKALTTKNKLEKEGAGFDEEIVQLDEMGKQMGVLHEALKDSWDKQHMSPKFYEALMEGQSGNPFDDFEDDDGDFDFGDIFGGDFEDEDPLDLGANFSKLFGTNDEEDLDPIKNPRFRDGQKVKVVSDTRPDYHSATSLKGFYGRVIGSYMDDGDECYEVEFHHDSLAKLSPEYVSEAMDVGQTFDEFVFGRNDLKKDKFTYDEEKTEESRYRMTLQHTYEDEKPEIQKVILDALTQDYQLEETENWLEYFENKLNLPVHAKSRGLLEGMRKGTKVQIIKLLTDHPDVGLIVLCLMEKEQLEMPHPLMDLTIAKKADKKMEVILDAYSIWAREEAGY